MRNQPLCIQLRHTEKYAVRKVLALLQDLNYVILLFGNISNVARLPEQLLLTCTFARLEQKLFSYFE
jgi:hypothetical protein